MQNLRNLWSPRRPDYHDPNTDYSQVHKLIDAPPYGDIYITNHGIEALRTQSQKFGAVVDYSRGRNWNPPGSSEYDARRSNNGKHVSGEKDVSGEYGRESSYNGEEINTEAEEFIQEEHRKLMLRKWMPTNSSIDYYQNQEDE